MPVGTVLKYTSIKDIKKWHRITIAECDFSKKKEKGSPNKFTQHEHK